MTDYGTASCRLPCSRSLQFVGEDGLFPQIESDRECLGTTDSADFKTLFAEVHGESPAKVQVTKIRLDHSDLAGLKLILECNNLDEPRTRNQKTVGLTASHWLSTERKLDRGIFLEGDSIGR